MSQSCALSSHSRNAGSASPWLSTGWTGEGRPKVTAQKCTGFLVIPSEEDSRNCLWHQNQILVPSLIAWDPEQVRTIPTFSFLPMKREGGEAAPTRWREERTTRSPLCRVSLVPAAGVGALRKRRLSWQPNRCPNRRPGGSSTHRPAGGLLAQHRGGKAFPWQARRPSIFR